MLAWASDFFPSQEMTGKRALRGPSGCLFLLPSEPKGSKPKSQDREDRKGAPGALRPKEPNCPDSPSSQINSAAGWRQQEANWALSLLPHLQERSGEPTDRPRGREGAGWGREAQLEIDLISKG